MRHHPPHTGRAALWIAAWPILAVFVLSNAATPLYGLWQREIGFSTGTLTVVFACYIAGLLGSLLFAGALSDRIGRKHVLLPALALAALASVLFAFADSVPELAAARLLTGVTVGATVSAGMAAVADVAGPARKAQGSLLASTAMVLGAGLGPLLAGAVSETLPGPTSAVFVIELVLLTLAFAVVARLPLPTRTSPTGPRLRLPSVPAASHGRLAAGIAVFAPGITATSFVLSLGPTLLGELLGATSRTAAGAMAFAMFAAATGVQFAVRGLSVRRILITGALATVASMAALAIAVGTSSAAALVLAALLAGGGQGLGQLGGLTLLATNVPGERLAGANAALNGGGYLLAGSLPVAAGYLSAAVGLTAGATVFAAVLAGLALLGLLVIGKGATAGSPRGAGRPVDRGQPEAAGVGR
ncbi:MFS transporter [Phytomonospora sp. NPDC050363]|uniref:MFS transporter n=1 Tax=Phytomonospora sp. NPDC050363 TaxID=3155642 RepID=UPI0033E96425